MSDIYLHNPNETIKVSNLDIQREFKNIDENVFLPVFHNSVIENGITARIADLGKKKMGLYSFDGKKVTINSRYSVPYKLFIDTLTHEMVHAYQHIFYGGGGHNKWFYMLGSMIESQFPYITIKRVIESEEAFQIGVDDDVMEYGIYFVQTTKKEGVDSLEFGGIFKKKFLDLVVTGVRSSTLRLPQLTLFFGSTNNKMVASMRVFQPETIIRGIPSWEHISPTSIKSLIDSTHFMYKIHNGETEEIPSDYNLTIS